MTSGTLIEGVGDEVVAFFAAWVLVLLAVLAWWTTNVTDRPLRIQTIIVGQRVIHVRGDGAEQDSPTTEGDGSSENDAAAAPAVEPRTAAVQQPAAASSSASADQSPADKQETSACHTDTAGAVPAADDTDARAVRHVGRSDAAAEAVVAEDASVVRRRVCHAAAASRNAHSDGAAAAESRRRSCSPLERVIERELSSRGLDSRVQDVDTDGLRVTSESALHQSATVAEAVPEATDANVSTARPTVPAAVSTTQSTAASVSSSSTTSRAAAVTSGSVQTSSVAAAQAAPAASAPAAPAATASGPSIMVKLKFLNDTQRLVEGTRGEALADFKRRHFPAETAANRLVRLIFNGRLLSDAETLDQCGLYDNCVVHCHVSTQPRPAPPPAGSPADPATGLDDGPLDLSMLLCPALTSAMTLVWGVRLRYPELFSGLATALLVLLTLLLSVFTAATFLPLTRLGAAPADDPADGARRHQRLGR